MTKVVINNRFGGFGLPEEIMNILSEQSHIPDDAWHWDIPRDDKLLVMLVEKMTPAEREIQGLKVVEIPDDVEWEINEHDGNEWVAEKHRRWS